MVTLATVMNNRRNSPAALRFEERRRRENEAPRLRDAVPDLVNLQLQIEDRSGMTSTKHVRRFVVDNAPALFLVPCADARCADGEHDLTPSVLRALREHKTTFQGEDECTGNVGLGVCSRVLHFDAVAEYRS
jgi:hypothetical protein